MDDQPPQAPTPPPPLASSRELQGQTSIHVEGAAVTVDGAGLWAVLSEDVDGDQDRDALTLALDTPSDDPSAARRMTLNLARREGDHFVSQTLAHADATTPAGGKEPCAVETATLRILSAAWAHAQMHLRCGASADDESGADDVPTITAHFFIELDRGTPRVKERIVLLGGLDGAGALSLEPALEDLDEDGHPDFRLHVTGPHELSLDLPLKDRAAGLILDPEPALMLLSAELDAAESAIDGDPSHAADRANRAVAWSRAFCRQHGRPGAFRVGNGNGLACRDGERAERMDVVTRLSAGDYAAATELLDGLTPTQRRGALEHPAAARALERARQTVTVREVTQSGDGDLVFRDDATLAILGEPPVRFTLEATGGSVRAADPGVPAVMDRTGNHTARLVRGCGGIDLEVVSAFQRSARINRATVIDAPVSQPCASATLSPDHAWRVLGWAPQGILIGAPGARRLVAVTAETQLADTTDLGLTTPPPAPLRGPRVTPDGKVWIVESPLGVMRYDDQARMTLWWPADWPLGERAEAAAISPDGTRIAVLLGNRVAILEAAP